MGNQIYATLQLELATLVRHIAALTPNETPGNLDRSGFLILHHLKTNGPSGIKAIANHFKLDISTASRQARVLEAKNCVYRMPNPNDKRAYTLAVTDKGEADLASYRKAKIARIQQLFGSWDETDLTEFARLLEKSNQAIRESDL